MISIKSITVVANHRLNDNEYPWAVNVVANVDVKHWTKMRNKKSLGMLYGVDISNMVYSINKLIPAHGPLVDDSKRASKGIKTIQLTYFLGCPERAKSLGCKILAGKYSSYGESVRLV
jgi:hypothetical protein